MAVSLSDYLANQIRDQYFVTPASGSTYVHISTTNMTSAETGAFTAPTLDGGYAGEQVYFKNDTDAGECSNNGDTADNGNDITFASFTNLTTIQSVAITDSATAPDAGNTLIIQNDLNIVVPAGEDLVFRSQDTTGARGELRVNCSRIA